MIDFEDEESLRLNLSLRGRNNVTMWQGWDIEKEKHIFSLFPHKGSVTCLRPNPGLHSLSLSLSLFSTPFIFSSLCYHFDFVCILSPFLSEGTNLYSGSDDLTVKCIDLRSFKMKTMR